MRSHTLRSPSPPPLSHISNASTQLGNERARLLECARRRQHVVVGRHLQLLEIAQQCAHVCFASNRKPVRACTHVSVSVMHSPHAQLVVDRGGERVGARQPALTALLHCHHLLTHTRHVITLHHTCPCALPRVRTRARPPPRSSAAARSHPPQLSPSAHLAQSAPPRARAHCCRACQAIAARSRARGVVSTRTDDTRIASTILLCACEHDRHTTRTPVLLGALYAMHVG
jgi:hypothetical protein